MVLVHYSSVLLVLAQLRQYIMVVVYGKGRVEAGREREASKEGEEGEKKTWSTIILFRGIPTVT